MSMDMCGHRDSSGRLVPKSEKSGSYGVIYIYRAYSGIMEKKMETTI